MSASYWLLGFAAGTVTLLILTYMFMKPFFWRIAICAVPLAVAGWVTGEAYENYASNAGSGFRFNLGVDLAGGTILVYEAQASQELTEKEATDLAAALKKRIDPTNTREITIRPIPSSPPRVEIILPMKSASGGQAASDIADIKDLISRQGKLEFRILADGAKDADAVKAARDAIDAAGTAVELQSIPAPASFAWVELGDEAYDSTEKKNLEDTAKGGGYKAGFNQIESFPLYYAPNARDPRNAEKRRNRYFVLTQIPPPEATVLGESIKSPRPGNDQLGGLTVNFSVIPPGDDAMRTLTTPNVNRLLSVVMDGHVMSFATIKSPLSNAIQVEMGRGDAKEVHKRVTDLIRVLRSGALPATLKSEPVSELSMGPGLGEDTIKNGTYAIVVALVGVIVFMIVYYHFAGGVASVALFANLLLTVGFMVAVKAAFTLPGLAGLVLTLGMAVDANVLIYERMREERERGASLALAIRNGYDRAFPTIIDTHLTSIFTAIVLYAVGNDQLKGFGVSLTAGLVISLFTSLYMTRLIFDILLARNWLPSLSMLKILTKPNFDFMKYRYHWMAGTVAVSLFGVLVFVGRGEDGLNIDFNGGTAYSVEFKEPIAIKAVRDRIAAEVNPNDSKKLKDVAVEALAKTGFTSDETTQYTFRTTRRKEWESDELGRNSQISEVRRIISETFKGELVMVEPTAGPLTPVADDPRFSHKVEISFANKNVAETDVGKVVGAWLAERQVGRPTDYFEVKGVGEPDEQGLFSKVAVRFKIPEELTLAGEKLDEKLVSDLVATLHQPKSERLENFDSQLAAGVQKKALLAVLLSWLAISLYLWFRFGSWTFGVAAVLCLIHDLAFTVGLIGISHYVVNYSPVGGWLLLEDFKIDLPAVAALLTLIGYSVNDTIVVFDRIREVRGKSPELTPKMINDSVNQTLSRSLITSLTVFIVVFILYVFGGGGIHLFSFVMVVGVVVGSYSSIFVASPLLLIFGEGKQRSRTPALQPQEAGV